MKVEAAVKVSEKKITASGTIGAQEEFFQDHFPGFPVVPGVLILEIFKKTAEQYYGTQESCSLREVKNVKFSNYLRPGDSWEADLEAAGGEAENLSWKARLVSGGRTVCSAQFKLVKNSKKI